MELPTRDTNRPLKKATCSVGALARRCDVRTEYASDLHPSFGWVPGAPPCIWTFLSSLGKSEFFSIVLADTSGVSQSPWTLCFRVRQPDARLLDSSG